MSTPLHSEHEEILTRLVGEALERRDAEGSVDIDALCSEHPELAGEVRSALAVALRMPSLQSAGIGVDRRVGGVFADRYQIQARIGAGAMGVVYAADDLDLGRPVALKVLHVGLLDANEAAARFEREASALAAVDHESIVTIFDRGVTADGSPFLVMERIDGVSLARVLDEARSVADRRDDTAWITEQLGVEGLAEPNLLRQSVRWCASLASGLEAAHRAGVHHRDVKPSNVMIRRDGRAVLLDFGIATVGDDATLTRSDAAIGTPAYMAPEALQGRVEARPSQDVYGLTATLYHLMTLRAPYQGSPSEVLTALATRDPQPAIRVRPGLPRDAQAILDAGLAREPRHRYASAHALENDLRAFLAYRPVSVRPVSVIERGWRRLRRSRAAQGAMVAALALAGVFAYGEYKDAVAASRAKRFDAAHVRIPANLGIVKKSNRIVASPEAREAIRSALDDAVDARHEIVGPRTMRATFRSDYGDHAGAAEDMRAVADHLGTPFARALAERYEVPAEGDPAILELGIAEMPEPTTPEDGYLAAFHALRHGGANPNELLPREGLDHVRHARELRSVLDHASVPRIADSSALVLAAARAHTAILELEGQIGSRSAMTAHWAAAMLALQSRYTEAVETARAGLELTPHSHVTLMNAAYASHRLGMFAEARAFAQEMIALLPHYEEGHARLARIEVSLREHDRARALMENAPLQETRSAEVKRRTVLGAIEADRALEAYTSGREDDAKAAARAALDEFSTIARPAVEVIVFSGICRGIVDGDEFEVRRSLFEWIATEPMWYVPLDYALAALPDSLDTDDTEVVRGGLEAIRDALSARGHGEQDVR